MTGNQYFDFIIVWTSFTSTDLRIGISNCISITCCSINDEKYNYVTEGVFRDFRGPGIRPFVQTKMAQTLVHTQLPCGPAIHLRPIRDVGNPSISAPIPGSGKGNGGR